MYKKYLLSAFEDFKSADSSAVKFALAQLKEFYGSGISKRDVALLALEFKGREL